MISRYIFKSINTNKEKKSFKEFLRHQTNSEYGGYKIYDGSRNHLLQIPEELSELIFFLNNYKKKHTDFKNFLETHPNVSVEMIYTAFSLSNEYQFY